MDDWVKITKESGSVTDITNGDKVFKNGPSKICGRKPFKNFFLVHS